MRVAKGKGCLLKYKIIQMQKSSKLIFIIDACLLYHHISYPWKNIKIFIDNLPYVPQINHDYSTSVLHDSRKKNSATEPIPNEETND